MVINQGLAGPKRMAKAARDGQPVNIPAPPRFSNGVTEETRKSALLDLRSWTKEMFSRQIRKTAARRVSLSEKILRASVRNSFEEPSKKNF